MSLKGQKRALTGFSLAIAVIGLLAIIGGIILVIFGSKNIIDSNHLTGGLQLGFGIALIILGGSVGVIGLYMFFVGLAVKATNGSIAQGNVAKNGTINMKKCPNCGAEIKDGDEFCTTCGKSLSDKLVCPKCGATNMSENKKCSACGADLK